MKLVRSSRTNTAVIHDPVCGFYGSTIEAFYFCAKMGLPSGMTAEYLSFMDGQIPRLAISRDIIGAYTIPPEDTLHMDLIHTLDTVAKGKVIESLSKVMTEKDLRSIVSIVSAVRDPLIRFQK